MIPSETWTPDRDIKDGKKLGKTENKADFGAATAGDFLIPRIFSINSRRPSQSRILR